MKIKFAILCLIVAATVALGQATLTTVPTQPVYSGALTVDQMTNILARLTNVVVMPSNAVPTNIISITVLPGTNGTGTLIVRCRQ